MNGTRESAFCTWLLTLPDQSLERLRAINTSTSSSGHIILALTYGLYDGHIRKINRVITSMLVARLRAERAGKTKLVARINSFMDEIHESIDKATGTMSHRVAHGTPCSRPVNPVRSVQAGLSQSRAAS